MIAALLLMQAVAGAPETFTCEHLQTDETKLHDPLQADLTLRHIRVDDGDGRWSVQRPGKDAIDAATFPAEFGSIGGSVAFRWTEADGKQQTAVISFSDIVMKDGSKGGWLSLGKPSLWQAPGYMCSTPPLKSQEGAK